MKKDFIAVLNESSWGWKATSIPGDGFRGNDEYPYEKPSRAMAKQRIKAIEADRKQFEKIEKIYKEIKSHTTAPGDSITLEKVMLDQRVKAGLEAEFPIIKNKGKYGSIRYYAYAFGLLLSDGTNVILELVPVKDGKYIKLASGIYFTDAEVSSKTLPSIKIATSVPSKIISAKKKIYPNSSNLQKIADFINSSSNYTKKDIVKQYFNMIKSVS